MELKASTLGILSPSHILLQIAEYKEKIAELEARLLEALPIHNLPPRDYESFVGRQKELAEVYRLLLPYPKSQG
ncbi:hypothetical protein F7734_54890 [Scytonema sp. UIC 10036]|uniref:hypothetical protein n=1 Tax=Scytonema sp. UIC 10036 TaxID=2304196 RepID=UPI0012DA0D17|nr:hypothetical protein [Scytonema sp. UIC 10036]MUH00879.1 hypothetical protein [Scytonema sp. UIC 10036]